MRRCRLHGAVALNEAWESCCGAKPTTDKAPETEAKLSRDQQKEAPSAPFAGLFVDLLQRGVARCFKARHRSPVFYARLARSHCAGQTASAHLTQRIKGSAAPRADAPKNKERFILTKVTVREGEHVERALKRFKRKVEQAGILKEVKKRKNYLKPSVKARIKSRAAASRARKQAKRMLQRD